MQGVRKTGSCPRTSVCDGGGDGGGDVGHDDDGDDVDSGFVCPGWPVKTRGNLAIKSNIITA